jgi:16S rRNA (guanine527-N7)-methyltransferase
MTVRVEPGPMNGGNALSVPRETLDRFRTYVSRETWERLEVYVGLLRRWSGTLNLIAPGDLARVWSHHVADSLQLLPLFASHRPPLLDIGLGGGFPGMVLAIALGGPVSLVERDKRKAAFLREVAHTLSLPVNVHAADIERLDLPPHDIVTARAVAPLAQLIAWSRPKLSRDGVACFFKKDEDLKELDAIALPPSARVHLHPNQVRPGGKILLIEGLGADRPGTEGAAQ